MNDLVTTERPQRQIVQHAIDVMDTARFEHMQRIATIMANSSLVPQALTHEKIDKDWVELAIERKVANCFLVVNQAVRWGMDPFAVGQCVSIVHGRLMHEGKLVAAVIDAKLNIKLDYQFGVWDKETNTTDLSREGKNDDLAVRVFELLPNGTRSNRFVDGYVGGWKTTGAGSPWTPPNYRRQLRYRGAREWSRAFEPALMLGAYTEDEMMDLAEDVRSRRAVVVGSSSSGREQRVINPNDPPYNPLIPSSRIQPSVTLDGTASRSHAGEEAHAEQGDANEDVANQSSGNSQSAEQGAGPQSGQGDASASPKNSSSDADGRTPPGGQDESETTSGDSAAGDGGSAAPSTGAPAKTFPLADYSRAMGRATQSKSLTSFNEQFRAKNPWTTDPDAAAALTRIFEAHQKRITGVLTGDKLAAELARLGAAS